MAKNVESIKKREKRNKYKECFCSFCKKNSNKSSLMIAGPPHGSEKEYRLIT